MTKKTPAVPPVPPVVPVAGAPAVNTTIVAGQVRENPVVSPVATDIPMPERTTNRGGKSQYNFAALTEVGMSFGVLNKEKAQVGPVVAKENRRHVEKVFGDDGVTYVETHKKRFEAFSVDPATDPDNAKVRVWRTA